MPFSAEELDLLEAVHADPMSDAPRLAYADWLEKDGRAERAEFIRLQCEASAGDSGESKVRRQALLDANSRAWAGRFSKGFYLVHYLRGFPLVVGPNHRHSHIDPVSIDEFIQRASPWQSCMSPGNFHRFHVACYSKNPGIFEAFANHPLLRRTHQLILHDVPSDEAAKLLATAPVFDRLDFIGFDFGDYGDLSQITRETWERLTSRFGDRATYWLSVTCGRGQPFPLAKTPPHTLPAIYRNWRKTGHVINEETGVARYIGRGLLTDWVD